MNTIWALDHNVDDFKYLGSHNEKTSRFPRHDGTPELETWEPQYIRYSVWDTTENKKIANFPSWSGNLVCDLEAKEKLRELIEDYVEFLPLASHTITDTQFFFINTIKILDCLDPDLSEFVRWDIGKVRRIKKYVLKPDCIKGVPIFKFPERIRGETYVTDTFKQIVEDNNLTGLIFKKVWEE